jgi:hypothetical protein
MIAIKKIILLASGGLFVAFILALILGWIVFIIHKSSGLLFVDASCLVLLLVIWMFLRYLKKRRNKRR